MQRWWFSEEEEEAYYIQVSTAVLGGAPVRHDVPKNSAGATPERSASMSYRTASYRTTTLQCPNKYKCVVCIANYGMQSSCN